MSAAAVLRSASCGALRRPTSFFSVTEQLFLHRSPIASRGLHSSDGIVNKPNKLTNSAHVERILDSLNSMIASYDRMDDLAKQILENMRLQHKRKIARRRLFGGVSIILGLAVYANQRSKKNDTPTTTEQKMSN